MLIRAAAIGTLALTPVGCRDDDNGGTMSGGSADDAFPTAGPCAHDPMSPECGTGTGTATMTSMPTMTTAATDDSMSDSSFDTAPTIPCLHNPDDPGCGTGSSSSTGGDTGGDTDTDTDTDGSSTGAVD